MFLHAPATGRAQLLVGMFEAESWLQVQWLPSEAWLAPLHTTLLSLSRLELAVLDLTSHHTPLPPATLAQVPSLLPWV